MYQQFNKLLSEHYPQKYWATSQTMENNSSPKRRFLSRS